MLRILITGANRGIGLSWLNNICNVASGSLPRAANPPRRLIWPNSVLHIPTSFPCSRWM